MPVFQGFPIAVGDKLEHISDGRVTVMQLYDNSIMVNIPGVGSRHFTYGGVLVGANRPTLFWQDIRIVIPPKDPMLWAAQRDLLKKVSDAIGPMAARIRDENEPYEEFASRVGG